MPNGQAAEVGVASPAEAWEALRDDSGTLLVDVRTRAEWTFVGVPDVSGAAGRQAFIEWNAFPSAGPRPEFLAELDAAMAGSAPRQVFFLCRSGGRSLAAAHAASAHFGASGRDIRCVNVAEGFEGDLDAAGRRGVVGGWKARGLPWRQS